jgi:uncharacterized protein YkwD
VTSVPAAAPVRLLASALIALTVLAALLAGRAEAAPRDGADLLAPAGVCRSADDPFASHREQIRAVSCLLNWARAEAGHGPLARRPALQRAATLKGRRVASCGQFSHTPCGSAVTAAVKASGYRYGWFGENLFAGTWKRVSAREVVSAWLGSAPHRANVLRPQFRHVGVAPVRARGLLEGTDAVVWTATFASPR